MLFMLLIVRKEMNFYCYLKIEVKTLKRKVMFQFLKYEEKLLCQILIKAFFLEKKYCS